MCGAADAAPRCPQVVGPSSQEPRFMQGASISEYRQLIKNGNGAWALRSLRSWRPGAPRPVSGPAAGPCSRLHAATGQRKKRQRPVSPGAGGTREDRPGLVSPHTTQAARSPASGQGRAGPRTLSRPSSPWHRGDSSGPSSEVGLWFSHGSAGPALLRGPGNAPRTQDLHVASPVRPRHPEH